VRSDDLRGQQFSTHRPGYDKTEVEAFLNAAGLRLAALESTDIPAGPLVSGPLLVAWAEWADSTTFSTTRLREAYDTAEVDAFREAIRDTFMGIGESPVRADGVRGKKFSSTDWSEQTEHAGYDKKQVAAFLDAAGLRLAAMESTDRRKDHWLAVPFSPGGLSGPTRRDFQPPALRGTAMSQRRWTPSRKGSATRSSGSGNPCSHRMRPATSSSRPTGLAMTADKLTRSSWRPPGDWP